MKQTIKHKKIGIYATWKALPEEERIPKTYKEMAEQLGMTPRGLRNWDKELAKVDSPDEIEQFRRQVFKMAMRPSATAKHMELYARLKGLYVEKSEQKVTLELSADELARRNLEADRQLREGGYGMAEVSKELSIPHDPVCLDTGQEHREDN